MQLIPVELITASDMKTKQASRINHSEYRARPSAEYRATVVLGLMVSLPFLVPVHTLPIPSFHSEWLAMLLGCLAAMVIARTRSTQHFWVPGIGSAPLALIAVVLLQWALGMFSYGASAFTLSMILVWGRHDCNGWADTGPDAG
ncbi:MAG: hypothetical protein HEQ39_08540 [Rhizobacter sp.]